MTNKDLSQEKRELLEKWLQGKHVPKEKEAISQRPENSPIVLSLPQQRQLFLELLDSGTAVNNLSVFFKMKGMLNTSALERSANKILARHEVLRTCFSFDLGQPTPKTNDSLTLSIPTVPLPRLSPPDFLMEAKRFAALESLKPFDLTQAPLIRMILYKGDLDEHLLLVVIHHTIADGWSLGVFIRELMVFYKAELVGKHPILPELPIQYSDFAYWQNLPQRDSETKESLAYWEKQLGGELPILELPIDMQRKSRQTYAGGTHMFVIDREMTAALEALARNEDATLFMVLLTVFDIVLHRYSGQTDILVGSPVANRTLPEIESLIGVFINTIVLRTDLTGNPTFRDLLQKARKVTLGAFAHQNLPFEKLVEAIKPRRDLSRSPVFQVVFNLQNSPMPEIHFDGIETGFVEIESGVSQFDLTLMVTKHEGQCQASVSYNKDIFLPATIERIFSSYQLILQSILQESDQQIAGIPYLDPREVNRFLLMNRTEKSFPKEKCFHHLFEEQVLKIPEKIAVEFGGEKLTYMELNQRVNQLVHQLLKKGVKRGARVGILINRSIEMLVALLAVQKSGGAYIPIHTAYPKDRIKFIIQDAQIQLILANMESERIDDLGVEVLVWSKGILNNESEYPNPQIPFSPDDLAYIIYTSGSTGFPKGVMVKKRSLMNFLWSMKEKPGMGPKDRLLAVTSISFDISALELYLPLLVGGSVVMASEEMLSSPVLLVDEMEKKQINIMQATPGIWQLILETGWKGKKELKALCGGEPLTKGLAEQLIDRVESLWNMYGPTETTIWSSVALVRRNDPTTIGSPIANTQLYVLDAYQQVVPVNVVGELHIGGEGLAHGYLNQLGLTEEKFISNPFSPEGGQKLYKTGDLARYREDGSIEILGRSDDQVKINGNRIELGEITKVLLQHPSVMGGIVLARAEKSGEKRLIAYFVPKSGFSPKMQELKDFLGKKLPSYMVPTLYIELSYLPLTTSGKVDKKSLPLPEDVQRSRNYEAPRNKTERILADIWQNVLHLEQVGVHDNFFELGGASMQSLQMIAKANMYGFKLKVEQIFEYQTIAELAEQLKIEAH